MIIKNEMRGHCVHHIYVDGGSSSEILYEHCFNRFRLEVRNQTVLITTPLVGFSGEIIWPLRKISLLVKIGDEEHSTSTWMNFMVVRSHSPYNIIIRRPRVRKIRAVLSTAHEILSFPVIGRTVTLQSSKIIPLECTMVSGPGPADMTGVPRHIAEHKLNIHEGCLPVRQKKRRQAPERNKAIYEEVEKLMDAKIIKEVHYHSWMSNPLMVKKHDAAGEQIGVKNLQANVDSRLVANQINRTYIAKESGMIKYLEKVKNLTSTFKKFSIKQILREENKKADALSKMASTNFAYLSIQVLVEELKENSIDEKEVLAVVEEEGRTWMTSIYEYLMEEILPKEKRKARSICRKTGRDVVTNGIIYKMSLLGPWLRYVGLLQANYVL
nr:reverse transcriptase domain-containing protein [Tanacetum cinerariifolium]